jgi:hypothetical protein
MDDRELYKLLQIDEPRKVLEEVHHILSLMSADTELAPLNAAFSAITDLYEGKYPGYRSCNTEYHDLRHTTDTLLAMARLLHGAILDGDDFSRRFIIVGLIAAIFHDAGYIQENGDTEGTGAKFTPTHVQRSMGFFERYGRETGMSVEEIAAGKDMIYCTDLWVDIAEIELSSRIAEDMGKILAVADLWAQMADRVYLEKLLFLYQELKECYPPLFKSHVDLIRKTIEFYGVVDGRLTYIWEKANRIAALHFKARYDIAENLYHFSMEGHKEYLKQIVKLPDDELMKRLRRNGIVEKISQDASLGN